MTADDVLVTVVPCSALPGMGPGRPAPAQISLDSLAFRAAGDPRIPRGHALADGSFRFGEQCLTIQVDFGDPPTSSLQKRVDDLLASLSVER